MLKSTFKKVSAIAIAGTMLAGMMAVPANAMTAQTVNKDVVIPAISENFTNAVEKDYTLSASNVQTIEGISNVSFKKVESWNERKLSVMKDEGNNVVKFATHDGINLEFTNPDGPINLQSGDKINISFRFKYVTAPASGKDDNTNMKVVLNDVSKPVKVSYDTSVGSWMNGGVNSNGSIMSITPRQFGVFAGNLYGAPGYTAGEWNTVNIEIDTSGRYVNYDSGTNGVQTVTVTVTKPDGTSASCKYKVDANYTGDSDTTADKYDKFEKLIFYTNSSNGSELYIDDVSVAVEGTRSHTEYVSDLSKVLLDENFDNFTGSVTANGTLTGTQFKMSKSWGPNDVTVKPVNGAANISGGAEALHSIRADFDDVAIGADDIIRVSYDRTNGGQSVNSYLSMTGTTKPAIKLTHVKDDTLTGTDAIDCFQETRNVIRPGGKQLPKKLGGDKTLLDGTVYHVEYIIKISDPEYGNKQTVTVNVADDNGQVGNHNRTETTGAFSQTYYLDVDNTTETEDKFTSLSSFSFHQYWGSCDFNIDNLKVEVIKPGFEVVDVNNSTNTWTFSGTTPIELNYVTNASAASKVIVAQYADGGRMIDAEIKDLDATGAGTVTVTPNSTAKKIKAMVIDMNSAVPFAKVFVMTRQ